MREGPSSGWRPASWCAATSTLATIDLYLPGGLVEGIHSLSNARTAGFTVLVLAQLFNSFTARSETVTAFHRVLANRWLWGAVGLSALLQVAVVQLPFFNRAFTTTPLSLEQWLACLAMASAVLWASEIRKLFLRLGSRSENPPSPTGGQWECPSWSGRR
ncbi:MAG TPA: cation-translocating P-type ATPase C-terminal domain-containing protein [Actinomycetes bacterium]